MNKQLQFPDNNPIPFKQVTFDEKMYSSVYLTLMNFYSLMTGLLLSSLNDQNIDYMVDQGTYLRIKLNNAKLTNMTATQRFIS